jgi:hypothetical protein
VPINSLSPINQKAKLQWTRVSWDSIEERETIFGKTVGSAYHEQRWIQFEPLYPPQWSLEKHHALYLMFIYLFPALKRKGKRSKKKQILKIRQRIKRNSEL